MKSTQNLAENTLPKVQSFFKADGTHSYRYALKGHTIILK
jgi:hypothetical protein